MPDQETIDQRVAERNERRRKNAAARRTYRAKQKAKRAEATKPDAPSTGTEARQHGPGRPKVRQGIVISAKPDKTISVRIDTARRHRMYKKIIRSSSTLHVHDERNEANEGDLVRVIESRPLSKSKRWRLVEILERSR
jgi:small subunit ribosomal protein S17